MPQKVPQRCRSLKAAALVVIELSRKIKVGRFYFFYKYLKLKKSRNEFEMGFVHSFPI